MNYTAALMISSLLGFLGMNLLRSKDRIDPVLHLIASVGLGLALSGQIIFYSLFILGHYNLLAVSLIHGIAFAALIVANIFVFKKEPTSALPKLPGDRTVWIGFGLLSLLLIPLWREAHFFPFGGWDAWACWNLKAKFIFLGGDHWKNMLDPSMWRSNNQYPFLLPLINVWGWSFYRDASVTVPLANALVFTFMTAALMFWGLKSYVKNILSVVPPLALFTIPFMNTLSISQYSDIVFTFYLLGSFVCLIRAREEKNIALAVLSGLFCGAMSFAKTEGSVACLLIMGLSIPYLWRRQKELLMPLFTAAILSALPTIFFQLFWATPNASFINGWTSSDHPVTFLRLKVMFMFMVTELISLKWHGLWIILGGGLILGWARSLKSDLKIVPIFLSVYLAIAAGYYFINTHYEIVWWMGTTLNRILYTILPLIVWWIFTGVFSSRDKK